MVRFLYTFRNGIYQHNNSTTFYGISRKKKKSCITKEGQCNFFIHKDCFGMKRNGF